MNHVAVFAYAFPHRKTQDFLIGLADSGCNKVCVIAAPWKALAIHDDKSAATEKINFSQTVKPLAVQEICQSLGMPYFCLEHGDENAILQLQEKYNFEYGLIAGARIISHNIIKIFSKGIINFHPGKLPETSGLDAFFYSIKKNIPWGVTAHFIDEKVDAGKQIFFKSLSLDGNDTPSGAHEKMHQAQLLALKEVTNMLMDQKPFHTVDIIRREKNSPMTEKEKQVCLKNFSAWVAATHAKGS